MRKMIASAALLLGIATAGANIGYFAAQAQELSAEDAREESPEEAEVRAEEGAESTPAEESVILRMTDEELREEGGVRAGSRGFRLSGNDLAAYVELKKQIEEVAAGERTVTAFSVPISRFGIDAGHVFTEDEMMLSGSVFRLNEEMNRYEYNEDVLNEAYEKLNEWIAVDFDTVFHCLTSDCPYSLYWSSYKASWIGSDLNAWGEMTGDGEKAFFKYASDAIHFDFAVSEDYALSATETDPERIAAAAAAADRAKEIVEEAADMPDEEKLAYYKDVICEKVSYSKGAFEAGDADSYGSTAPWQVIDVFAPGSPDDGGDEEDEDGEEGGEVVCEAYSKAFQYLCDLTEFEDEGISCHTVGGVMEGGTGAGSHTWNLVTFGDGSCYLADITNCDEGSAGEPDLLFLCLPDDGGIADGYRFTLDNGMTVWYQYDEGTKQIYSGEELLLHQ